MNRLKGKTALITGASLGIGRAIAVRMAERARRSRSPTRSKRKARI